MDDDVRQMELESLEAIYPEIHRTEKDADAGEGSLAFQLELAVQPDGPVTVTFPAPAAGIDAAGIAGQHQRELGNGPAEEDSLQVSHLPPLFLRMSLVEGYPETLPPRVSLSTNPEWLTRETLNRLEADAHRLWGEMAHDLVAYAYIDHLQRSADDVFGTVGTDGTLQVDPQHKLAVLDYDIKAKKTAFEKETFDCGICLGMFKSQPFMLPFRAAFPCCTTSG